MIGEWIRTRTAGVFQNVARGIVRLGVSADIVTLAGLLLSAVSAYFITTGHLLTAGIILGVAGLLDGVDGSVARISGHISPFGAFWDSIIDRFGESLTFLGILIYFMSIDSRTGSILAFVGAVSSLLVSYIRARGEGLGFYTRGGVLTRLERVAVLVVGLVSGYLLVALWLVSVLSIFTVFQRIYLVWAGLRNA